MLLNTDYIDPATLTGYVRAALADIPENRPSLARFLPNRYVDDLTARFLAGGEGLAEAATFRAYDAESPIGSRPGVNQVTVDLPPISRKIRLGEYDRLRQRRAGADEVVPGILNDAVRMTRSVAARMELARGEALVKGKLELDENGIIVTADYGRDAGHTVSAGTPWTTVATATPLADLLSWIDTYVATNGEPPGVILFSTRIRGLLARNAEIRGLVATVGGTPGIVSDTSLRAVFEAFSLPPFEIYDAKVNVGGTATRVIGDDKVLLLPAPVAMDDPDATDLGATMWGTTAESLDPRYGVEGDEPGIVAGSYSTDDPIALWTKAAGVGIPVLANPNLSFAADVA